MLLCGAAHTSGAAASVRQARRLPPAVSAHPLNITIPPAGALTPVSGVVSGLPNAGAHVACVYLESRIGSFNGPKPFEEANSNTPVAADGSFNYVGW